MTTALPSSRSRSRTSCIIGGRWVSPAATGADHRISPHTEQSCVTVAEATEADVDAAVAAARRAFDAGPWPR